jgi:putative hydrolase of the HAD superfamily
VIRGVVFDLWNTLAVWPEAESVDFRRRWSERIGVSAEALDAAWSAPGAYERRESGPIAEALSSVLATLELEPDVSEVVEWRMEMTRRALVPEPGVVPTLEKLRRRRISTGLISNCTEEVALVWDESAFASLFDVAVFSATARCLKPNAQIYAMALEGLGLEASDCLFVGDGANDELAGAERAGLTPVLFDPSGDGVPGWSGRHVSAIPQVLDLLE